MARTLALGLSGFETTSWVLVIIGVPQGSVLGSPLLMTCTNDTDVIIVCLTAKLADDTKSGCIASSLGKTDEVHSDLDKIGEWCECW